MTSSTTTAPSVAVPSPSLLVVALLVVPLVALAIDLVLHPQPYRNLRELQQVPVNLLLARGTARLGAVKGHLIHVSVDDLAETTPFASLRGRSSALVVSGFLDDGQVKAAALTGALVAKLRSASPDDARALLDLLARKSAHRAGDVLRFVPTAPGRDPAAFPPERVYLLLLDQGSPVSTDDLQKGLQRAIDYAKDDGVEALLLPCIGVSWSDRDNLSLPAFFATFFASLPEGDAPDIHLSLYRNWPTFELEGAVRAFNAAWATQFDTADKQRKTLNRLELRAGLLFWFVCLLVSAWRVPLTPKEFVIVSVAYGSFGAASNAGVATLAAAYPALSTPLTIGLLAVFAVALPFVVHWDIKNVFAPRSRP